MAKQKIQAKCYGVWGCPYYRTESGHTFSINETSYGKIVYYYGNVLAGDYMLKMLKKSEITELFNRVEFIT